MDTMLATIDFPAIATAVSAILVAALAVPVLFKGYQYARRIIRGS